MKAATIDNLDIKAHERYAQDQQMLDTSYLTDSSAIPPHSEIAVTLATSSKWEELFEAHLKNVPWAVFKAPPKYHLQANRFFTSHILPSIRDFKEQDENEEEEEKERERKEAYAFLLKAILSAEGKGTSLASFEKEKTSLVHLLEKIKHLNLLLDYVNARKNQYQKG